MPRASAEQPWRCTAYTGPCVRPPRDFRLDFEAASVRVETLALALVLAIAPARLQAPTGSRHERRHMTPQTHAAAPTTCLRWSGMRSGVRSTVADAGQVALRSRRGCTSRWKVPWCSLLLARTILPAAREHGASISYDSLRTRVRAHNSPGNAGARTASGEPPDSSFRLCLTRAFRRVERRHRSDGTSSRILRQSNGCPFVYDDYA
jgi:hypothetical protein